MKCLRYGAIPVIYKKTTANPKTYNKESKIRFGQAEVSLSKV